MFVGEVPPCINSTAQTNWLNRGDVRKALHIPDILPPWDICRYVTTKNNLLDDDEIDIFHKSFLQSLV